MKKYLVALDQGTTSSRAIVFDRSQQIVASAQKEFPQLYPQAGWVEHDPLELYSSQYGVMMEAITRGGIDPAEIAAIGITNQRETTIVWEKATGRPIYPAIVWQCRRTAALCDQQAALFGQCCFAPGEAKNTYGTGCFLLMNTGETPCVSRHGLVTTIAAGLGGHVTYALEGSVFVGGAVIQWLRDEMRFLSEASDAEYYAQKVDSTGGVYFVPAFTGLGAPYWDMYARGAIVGITRGTKREHIIRAAQESIAYQSMDLVAAMEKDTGVPLRELRVDGGASRDAFLMQFQADMLATPVRRPVIRETTALGAAYLAGLAVGIWHDPDELRRQWRCDVSFLPHMTAEQREKNRRGWAKAVGRSLDWAKEE